MTTTIELGVAITAGYLWTCRIESDALSFPQGVSITGQVRTKVSSPTVLTTLNTVDGSIVRVDDSHIEISIDGETSKDWLPGSVIFDLVRTDTDPDTYLGFMIEVPVIQTVTRDLP